jgi:hypothetical protein
MGNERIVFLSFLNSREMQYPFNLHSLTVCLTINFFFRVKPVREGERRSRRKLGLAPEFKAGGSEE